MEFSIRKRKKRDSAPILPKKECHKKSYNEMSINSTALTSMETSFISPEKEFESTIMNEEVRAKASMLLNLDMAIRPSVENRKKKSVGNREAKLSFMNSPKKNIVISEAAETFRKNKSKEKISGFNTSRITNDNPYTKKKGESKLYEVEKFEKLERLESEKENEYFLNPNNSLEQYKKKKVGFFSLPEYFQLVFSKIMSNPGKEKIYTLISELSVRYEKNPKVIAQDVLDIRSIAKKLQLALGPKETYVELKPFEALEVNGEFARLLFHVCHEIVARLYKNYDLAKIYREIEYCSRRLEFHQYTLKICFEMGELYKRQFDQENAHAYFSKALKLSIFLNDRFHEEKAIDCFGLTEYASCNISKAHFYHENVSKLNKVEREIIKEKYSNSEEIEANINQRNRARAVGIVTSQGSRREKYNFNGEEFMQSFELENKRQFKNRIKEYIQSPLMRPNILVAREHMNKIDSIGRIHRYKNFEASRSTGRFKANDDGECSTEILITHRSLNRINPDVEIRKIEREKKIILELIEYYINDSIDPFE